MYYFILNPAAGGHARPSFQAVQRVLHQRGIPHKLFVSRYSGHAAVISREIAARDREAVITAIGGDGTVNEVLRGLPEPGGITLGVIPCGLGNDFAKSLGIHEDPLSALEAVLHPTALTRIDLGSASFGKGPLPFAGSAGIGLNAECARSLDTSPWRLAPGYGSVLPLSTLGAVMKRLPLFEPFGAALTLDGGRVFTFPKTYFIALMNIRQEGGGLRFCPEASPTDGILDIFVCSGISRGEILAALPLAGSGRHVAHRGLHFLRCSSAKLETEKKLPIHLDGESGGMGSELQASLRRRALRVIVR